MKKRVLSLLMALALCFTMLPTAALAQQTGAADVYTTGEDTAVQDKQAAEAVRAVALSVSSGRCGPRRPSSTPCRTR